MTPEMARAGALLRRLSDFTNDEAFGSPRPALSNALCEESVLVIKELMDEMTRWENRANEARRKADELVGHLNGRWG